MADINDLISQAYAGIGRSDTGTGLAAVTQGEKDYWAGQIASGAINQDNFQSAFNNAVNEYKTANPNDPYTQYVNNYQAQQTATTPPLMTLQNAASAVNAPQEITPQAAQELIWRSMTTGVPTSEFDKYGGYDAVSKAYTDAGGKYDRSTIPASNLASYTQQVANTGSGNLGLLKDSNTELTPQAVESMRAAGIDPTPYINQYGVQKSYNDIFNIGDVGTIGGVAAAGALPWSNVVGPLSPSQQYDQNLYNQTGMLKSGFENIYGDDKVSRSEADAIDQLVKQTGFKAADISRVTGIPIEKVEEALASKYGYQLSDQTDPMKSGLTSVFADDSISWEEANQINEYATQYGFKPEDIARVTGVSLDKVNQALGARGNIIGQNISANLENPIGLIDYAQANKLSAKDLASSSGGVLSESLAQALLDKGSTMAGRIELADPAYYSQIKNVISRAVNQDYGGQESDWMYQMFSGLNPTDVSAVPKQLEFGEPTTKKATGLDPATDSFYEYDVPVPPAVKNAGVEPVYETRYGDGDSTTTLTGYRKKVDSEEFGDGRGALYANYDANGKLTGYEADNRIHTSGKTYYTGRWNADGQADPLFVNKGRSGFGGFLDDTIGGFKDMVGSDLWTLAKIFPATAPYANAADATMALSHGDVKGAALNAAAAYGAQQGNVAADTGVAGGMGPPTAAQAATMNTAATNAANTRLGLAAVSAVDAADNGNYAPLLALGANVSGINKIPVVATSMNVLSAANAISTGDTSSLLTAAGNLTNSPDLKLAGSANKLINAINSGDQAAIAVAGLAFSSAVKSNTGSAATALKTTLLGPATRTSDAGLPGGLQLAGVDGGTTSDAGNGGLSVDVSGVPIYAGHENASRVSVPVGYRLMDMSEADARPEGSYYDITQNAWLAPDEGGMNEIRQLQGALSGQVPSGYGTDVTDLDNSIGAGGLSGAASTTTGPSSSDIGNITVTADRPVRDDIPEIVVTADRPVDDIPEIVVTADRPVVDDMGEIVITDDRPVTPPPVVTPPPPKVVTPPSTPINPTPTKTTTTASPLVAATQTAPMKLDSSPQGLTSTMQKNKKILRDLTMLFGTLTPELVSALEDRGIRVPKMPEPEEEKAEEEKQEEPDLEKQLAEDRALETKFAAAGGEITSKIDPKITYTPAGMLPAAQVIEQQSRLGALRHLRDSISHRPAGGLAHGGLPKKYAEATPDGHKPEFITGLTGYYATGAGTGQSDDIDAMLHDGDYVADADLVAALGDGSSKAGAEALEKFRRSVPHQENAQGGSVVPAKIADGEYVFPASFVTALGKGDNKAGAALLDKMREAIRAHKRSAPTTKIPPKAKSPLDYLKMVKG